MDRYLHIYGIFSISEENIQSYAYTISIFLDSLNDFLRKKVLPSFESMKV